MFKIGDLLFALLAIIAIILLCFGKLMAALVLAIIGIGCMIGSLEATLVSIHNAWADAWKSKQ